MPPAIAPTLQSCTIPQVLDALTDRVGFYVGMPDRVIEWDSELAEMPAVQGRDFQAIKIVRLDPYPYDGAGRFGWKCHVQATVGIWTRGETDATGTIKAWDRRHWPNVELALNALAGRKLFSAYDPGGIGDPTGKTITGPLLLMNPDDLNKVTFRSGFGYTELQFQALIILNLGPVYRTGYLTFLGNPLVFLGENLTFLGD